ncbi:MAG TPA: cation transporter [Clostridia bacterium]|nr:cation transporter [Clostridia bacterium]
MLSQILIKRFIKDYLKTESPEVRERYGLLSGIVGIIANVFLFAAKLIMGISINSIAFIGDAFNNLTDAFSSVAVMLGFRLASKPADEKHPFGHGRIEYITGLIVSFIVILVGYELIKSSVSRIINPVPVTFSWPAFLLVILAILVKTWLFFFNKTLSQKIDSKTLLATAYDSLGDTIATGCIGLSQVASLVTTFPLDGYVGLLVSGVILYSGFSLTKETISPLLGQAPEQELIMKISQKIRSYKIVRGIHELVIHSYGPNQYMASIHVEVSADEDIMKVHEQIDLIEQQVAKELGILLTIHMDPLNLDSKEVADAMDKVQNVLQDFPEVLSFHDFRIVGKGKHENLVFDVVIKNGVTEEQIEELHLGINQKLKEKCPGYRCIITFDQHDLLANENNK